MSEHGLVSTYNYCGDDVYMGAWLCCLIGKQILKDMEETFPPTTNADQKYWRLNMENGHQAIYGVATL